MIHCKCPKDACDNSISLELPNDIRSPFLDVVADKREKVNACFKSVELIRIRVTADNLDYLIEQLSSYRKVLKERQQGGG